MNGISDAAMTCSLSLIKASLGDEYIKQGFGKGAERVYLMIANAWNAKNFVNIKRKMYAILKLCKNKLADFVTM